MTMTSTPSTTVYDFIPLRHGARLPRIGLGTSDDAARAVPQALASGYRLVDTAFSYGNESAVGAAVRSSGLPREEVFVTSKFNQQDHSVDGVERALDRSLSQLGLDDLDMLLVHWPNPGHGQYVEAWKGLVRLLEAGRLRAIGVSNFLPEHLERIIDATGVAPDVNQVELNPYTPRHELLRFHRVHGIATQGWSPLGRDLGLLAEPQLLEVAEQVGRAPAQVVLRWHLQLGIAPIPRSGNARRQAANLDVFDFELTTAQMTKLARLDRGEGSAADSTIVGH